ncbi:hypothetical protein DYB36_009765 [Aphanomyces astaci]|uniref:Anaphase-promoting complex subunit 4-like WD40 domain-containing protein n=1 Tax=Aphanomyces astaci TaxID=112090 RepID=A0A397B0W5_APHAT|nr:hypothetical protein DYB36_009765 [Aphanomyces astaci]
MASSPADPNHLLLAYEGSDVVYVWDLVKQRVAFQTSRILNQTHPASTVQSLAWHASGKRFAVGFASGSVAVCRSDKHQLAVYPTLVSSTTSSTRGIQRLHWLTTHASSPGALVCSVGSHVIVWFPPRDAQKGPKEALTELSSSSCFPWQTCVLPSHNHANVMDMAVASTVVPASGSSAAPFTAIVLAGNPLDGIKPSRTTWVVTAHADSRIKMWESHPPVDGASRGQMGLLHVLRVKPVLQDPISHVWFGPSRRLLVVGTSTGEVGFFTFDSDMGFSFVFSLHVHSGAITLLAVPKSDYPDDGRLDVAVADAFGVVCIVHVASQTYKLVIFDLALDTDDDDETGGAVESLIMDRSLLFVGRGDGHVQVYDVATAALVLTCRGATPGDGNGDHVTKMLLMDQGGRERGPVEVLSAAAAAADVVVVDTVTQALVDDLLGKFPSPPPTTNTHKHVTVCVEAGPLGIFLVDDVTDRAVLRQAAGIVPGSTLVRVNGVDVRRLNKADVVAVVSSLSGVAKTVSYALAPDHTSTDAHAHPYIVCAVGRSIKVFAVPTAPLSHESQPKPDNSVVQVDVEADVGLRAPVVSMAISAIPVEGR